MMTVPLSDLAHILAMASEYDRLKNTVAGLNIPVMGIASTDMWDTDPVVSANVPPERRPRSIMPEAGSAIVIGVPIQETVIMTAPSIYYRELYKITNTILDDSGQRIVMALEMMGHKAAFIPRDGYHGMKGLLKDPTSFFSHKHSAYLAGLGTFGVNNTILTERYGPRIRFTTILTDADLPSGRPMEKQLCIKCMKCRDICPVKAIGNDIYPASKIDKAACTRNSEQLNSRGISPCGRCIAVCPVGKDHMVPPTPAAIENIRRYTL